MKMRARQHWYTVKRKICKALGFDFSFKYNGSILWLNTDNSSVYHAIYSTEKLAKMAGLVAENSKVIFDVGGNCGIFSKFVSERCKDARVFCFEPAPDLIHVIKRNCGKNVTVVEKAISSKEGNVELFINENSQQTNSLIFDTARLFGDKEPKKRIVEAVALDNFAENVGVKKIDVIKFDIQGAELLGIQGAQRLLSEVESVFIEVTWMDGDMIFSLESLCRKFGFTYVYLVNPVLYGGDLLLNRREIDLNGNQREVILVKHFI